MNVSMDTYMYSMLMDMHSEDNNDCGNWGQLQFQVQGGCHTPKQFGADFIITTHYTRNHIYNYSLIFLGYVDSRYVYIHFY